MTPFAGGNPPSPCARDRLMWQCYVCKLTCDDDMQRMFTYAAAEQSSGRVPICTNRRITRTHQGAQPQLSQPILFTWHAHIASRTVRLATPTESDFVDKSAQRSVSFPIHVDVPSP
jgi:hypothetical protein